MSLAKQAAASAQTKRRRIQIDEVNVAQNVVTGKDQYGLTFQITYGPWHEGALVTVPKQGENWIIEQYRQEWRLKYKVEDLSDIVDSLAPGDKYLNSGTFWINGNVNLTAGTLTINDPVNPTDAATKNYVDTHVVAGGVTSVFGRSGAVTAQSGDYTVGQITGAAPLASPTFTGSPAAPTPALGDDSTLIPTTHWVKQQGYVTSTPVTSVFARTGAVTAQTGDYTVAQITGAAPIASPTFTGTVAFTDSTTTLRQYTGGLLRSNATNGFWSDGPFYANATAANQTGINSSGQITFGNAETDKLSHPSAGALSVNTSFTANDFIAAGLTGATAASRYVGATTSGAPVSGTFAVGDFVIDQTGKIWICTAAGTPGTWSQTGAVTSVFGRTGAVTAQSGDYTVAQITGAAPLASPTFTGTPAAPTPATADNSTTIATTAFVKAQGYLTSAPVTSVFTRTGAVTAATGDYTVGQITAGTNHALVISGASTLGSLATGSAGQILRSGGASADPAWSTSTYPSAAGGIGHVPRSDGTNYVDAQLAATDLSNGTNGLGAVLLASGPAMTNPTANTQTAGDNSTKLATTAFVTTAVAAVGSNLYQITQTAHGFTVGQVLIYNGTAYALAKADTADNAEVVGVVSSVIDANNFILQVAGRVSGLSGLTAGTTYFLSDTTAGALTATQPTTNGHVSKPLGVAVSTTALYFINMRGETLSPYPTNPNVITSTFSAGPPSSPSDGDIWIASAVDANGTRWQFQYNAGSSSSYKWEFIGGPPSQIIRGSTDSLTSNNIITADTNLGTFTIQRPGEYYPNSNYWISSMPTRVLLYFLRNGSNNGNWGATSVEGTVVMQPGAMTLAASDTFGIGVLCNSATAVSLAPRSLMITPRRVS